MLARIVSPSATCLSRKIFVRFSEKALVFRSFSSYNIKYRHGIRAAAMHRAKELEFSYMFVVAVNKRIVPLASAIDHTHTDAPAEAESLTAEKRLPYVALTMAQKKAYIASCGTPSEFLG